MADKKTLSIIIPVYNEEDYIGPCLDSIAAQTDKPEEVIVVDNNSTDKTAKIAKGYDFVTVLYEKKQHQTFAQKKGYDAAKTDILGRIDADTRLTENWVKNVKQYFDNHQETQAITGYGLLYESVFKKFFQGFFYFYHGKTSKLMSGHTMLWGANMAMRSSAWKKIRNEMHYRPDIWEDYDMSFHIAPLGKIDFVRGLEVYGSGRTGRRGVVNIIRYLFRGYRTYFLHVGLFRWFLLILVWATALLFMPVALLDSLIYSFRSNS